jgi:4-amino-4-deoxy-L-arabinose transferase-like glycosyltransferase
LILLRDFDRIVKPVLQSRTENLEKTTMTEKQTLSSLREEIATPLTEEEKKEPATLQTVERRAGLMRQVLVAVTVGIIVFLTLFFNFGKPGITWDEAAPNFVAARNQAEWFQNLFYLENPFSEETIEKYWSSPSTHPSLTRTLMAFSYLLFNNSLGQVRAMRLPSILITSSLAGIFFFWLTRRVNRVAALGAVTAWLTLPRLFGHVLLASLDVPMMAWWALTVICFYEGAGKTHFSRWHLLTGILYGLALSTKLHSFFLPIPLLLWMLMHKKWNLWRSFVAMAVLGILIYGLTQVYLWHGTGDKLIERFYTYSQKEEIAPVRILYFGRQFSGETPWHYPLMMTLLTTPRMTLFFTLVGLFGLSRLESPKGLRSMIVLNILVPMSLITLPQAQGYDGIRLIMPATVWLAVLAGLGLDQVLGFVRSLAGAGKDGFYARLILAVCFMILFVPNLLELKKIRPFFLGYYADWAGGVSGGYELGMETTYWCDALQPELLELMNKRLPDGANLKPLAMSYEVLETYQRLGKLKEGIVIDGGEPYNYHLLQCRQGFFGRIETAFYRGQLGRPIAMIEKDSVPFFMLFGPLPGAVRDEDST